MFVSQAEHVPACGDRHAGLGSIVSFLIAENVDRAGRREATMSSQHADMALFVLINEILWAV